jgi:Tfp pilus assembly protein PilO
MRPEVTAANNRGWRTPALLATAAAVVLAGAWTHYALLSAKRTRLQALQSKLADARSVTMVSARLPGEVALAREELREVARRVPSDGEVGGLLQHIGAAMNECNMAEREVVTHPTVAGSPFARIPLSLRLRGSFQDVFKLLGRIEQAGRAAHIDRLVVETSSEQRNAPLRVEIDLSTYSRHPEEAAAWAALE